MSAGEDIFISYRRDDASAYAGRILDYLSSLAGSHRVFMDVQDIRPGQNFAQAIDTTLSNCHTVLAVIGPKWRQILDERSAHHQEDYVVHELAAALARKVNVVPVLVGGASPSALANLPAPLADLPFHQAVQLHDDSFKEDCARLAAGLGVKPRSLFRNPLLWAAVTALIFLAGLIAPWRAWTERNARLEQVFKTAAAQSSQTDYQDAVASYQLILNVDPTNARALESHADAAMLWAENFHVLAAEDQKPEVLAAPLLDQLKSILQAASGRASGHDTRSADILAHLGWVHWLNEKIAFREFNTAEAFWRKSLEIDPSNVYAHAMLGNWMLQRHADITQALRQLDLAVSTGKQRPYVRELQLGGLHYNDDPGARAAISKTLNQMRANSEPLDDETKSRFTYLYSATVSTRQQLRETLGAVPQDDAWKTFLWVFPKAGESERAFIQATLVEIANDSKATKRLSR